MKKNDFSELIESIKEAGEIKAEKKKPSRAFSYEKPDIKVIRKRLHVSQREFALMICVSKVTLQIGSNGDKNGMDQSERCYMYQVKIRKPF